MAVTLPLLFYHNKFKAKISRFPLLIITAAIIIIPTFVSIYTSGILGQWINLLQAGDTQVNLYGARFPLPIFYLLETTVPMNSVNPIYPIIFVLGMFGVSFLVWRRKPEDKLLLVWFAVVYVFFTFVGTKSWRFILPIFPVIAISATNLLIFLHDKL